MPMRLVQTLSYFSSCVFWPSASFVDRRQVRACSVVGRGALSLHNVPWPLRSVSLWWAQAVLVLLPRSNAER